MKHSRDSNCLIKTKDFANQELLKALLPILDSLDGGQQAYQQDKTNIKALEEGLMLTQKMMISTLQSHDVHLIDPVGEKFDPHHHEVLTTMADEKTPSGHVIQVVQKGYLLKDRVVRTARVIVAQ